jgi:hypothetical protein
LDRNYRNDTLENRHHKEREMKRIHSE